MNLLRRFNITFVTNNFQEIVKFLLKHSNRICLDRKSIKRKTCYLLVEIEQWLGRGSLSEYVVFFVKARLMVSLSQANLSP